MSRFGTLKGVRLWLDVEAALQDHVFVGVVHVRGLGVE